MYDVASTSVDIRISQLNATVDAERLKCLVLVGKAALRLPEQFKEHGHAAELEHLLGSISDDFDIQSTSNE